MLSRQMVIASSTCCTLSILGRLATCNFQTMDFRAYGLQWLAFATFFIQRQLVTTSQAFADTIWRSTTVEESQAKFPQ